MKEEDTIKKVSLRSMAEFQCSIEEYRRMSGIGYVEAIMSYCNDNTIEPEDAVKLISPALKEKLTEEASSLRLLKAEHRTGETLFD